MGAALGTPFPSPTLATLNGTYHPDFWGPMCSRGRSQSEGHPLASEQGKRGPPPPPALPSLSTAVLSAVTAEGAQMSAGPSPRAWRPWSPSPTPQEALCKRIKREGPGTCVENRALLPPGEPRAGHRTQMAPTLKLTAGRRSSIPGTTVAPKSQNHQKKWGNRPGSPH